MHFLPCRFSSAHFSTQVADLEGDDSAFRAQSLPEEGNSYSENGFAFCIFCELEPVDLGDSQSIPYR